MTAVAASAGEAPKPGILARTAMGAAWMFGFRMATRLLGLVSTLVLVRLLTPEDFGLFALAFAVIATLDSLLATGVDAQLIRAHQTSRALYDTVFTTNVVRGAAMALLMLLLSAPAADFFREPRLAAVIQALAVLPLLGGLGNVGVAEFSRALDFRRVFLVMIVPRLLQIAMTIAAALALQSHWALVVGALGGRIAALAFSYVVHAYRPRLSLELWRELIGISFWTWAMNVGMAVRDRTATFAIGRVLDSHALGVYTVSVELASLPTSEIAGPVSQAAMPGLAAALRSGDPAAAGRAFLRILGSTAAIALPAALGISLVAAPFVMLLLGDRWLEAIPLIEIFGATWVGYSISLIGVALLDAQARLRRLFIFVAAGALLRAAAVAALAQIYGLQGLAIGLGIGLLAEAVLMISWCARLLGLAARDIAGVFWRPVAACAAMVLLLWGSGLGWRPPPATALAAAQDLLVTSAAGAAAYVGTLTLLWLAAGRPRGAESDLLAVARRLLETAARARPVLRPRRRG